MEKLDPLTGLPVQQAMQPGQIPLPAAPNYAPINPRAVGAAGAVADRFGNAIEGQYDRSMPNTSQIQIMKKDIKSLAGKKLKGQVGENAIWDGPLSKEGFPMGKGSSSGAEGMEVSKYPTAHTSAPITQKAKVYK